MKRQIITIKYGSSSVSAGQGMDKLRLALYAADLARLHKTYDLVIISSGSVSVGKALWKRYSDIKNEASMRALAMLGSGQAFVAWQDALFEHGILAGQLLVTHREVDDPTEGPSLRAAVADNIGLGFITIVNENDALSDMELAKLSYGGDNDGLAAHIALSIGASYLVLMTDVDGLRVNGVTRQVIEAEESMRLEAIAAAGKPGVEGRGGMVSKVAAALQAVRGGINAYIAEAGSDTAQVLAGNSGTRFVADQLTK